MEDEAGPIRLVEEGSLIRLEGDPEIEYLGPEDLMLASTSQILTQAPPQAHRSLPQHQETASSIASGLGGSGKPVTGLQMKLSCHRCDYKTFHRNALDRHIQAVHEKVKLYECDRCDYKTGHGSALKRHIGKLHEKSSQLIFACEVCDYQTVHKSALKRHVANRHQQASQVRHQCSVCEYSTTYEFALERHISTVHLKEGAFECTMCEYNTVHKHALDRHVKMVHEKPAHLACEVCDYKTAHKSALKMHFATAHEMKETFKCNKCGYETLYKTALHRHMTTVTCGQGEKVSGAGSLHRISQDNMRMLRVKAEADAPLSDPLETVGGTTVEITDSNIIYLSQPDVLSPPAASYSTSSSFSSLARRQDIIVGSELYQIAGVQRLDGSVQQVLPGGHLSLGAITVLERDGVLQPVTVLEHRLGSSLLQPVIVEQRLEGGREFQLQGD